MCGICGIRLYDRDARVDPALVARMNSRLVHRGPDDEGYHLAGNVGLGHRRLSIIDLEGGSQPIYNESGAIAVVFNGEIYNYRELRSRLRSRGHHFRTDSDTEVIVHAYEEYGDDCVCHFRGMFAFALADRDRDRLLLARDRLGIKPLYYHRDSEGVAFASEIKALLELPGAKREVDPVALDLYLSLRYVPAPLTMFREVRKLRPGHLLVADSSGVKIRRYWRLRHEPAPGMGFEQARERFRELVDEAVAARMIADVPLGVMLSGGLDSSSILASMTAAGGNEPVRSFSVGYADPEGDEDSDERGYARVAADHLGSDHHELALDAREFGDFLPRMVWHLDEPLADPTCAPLYFLSRMAREHVTVVLSGEGADEILGGYGIYRRMAAVQAARGLLPRGLRSVASRLAPLLPGEALRQWARRSGMPLEHAYTGVSRAFRPELKQRLLGDSSGDPSAALRGALAPHYADSEGASTLARMLHLDTSVWLPDDLLLKADRMTMANSMELRVPFLEHELVEFAASLPDAWKLGGGEGGKRLLREAFAPRLPRAIVERRKKGFPVPTRSWLRGGLTAVVHDTLMASDPACGSYMDRGTVRRLVREHDSGARDRTQELWALIVFETWHRQFIPPRGSATDWSASSSAEHELVANAARAVPPHVGTATVGTPAVATGHGGSGP